MRVIVAWAAPGQEDVVAVELPARATLADAITASGIAARHPGSDACRTGIWGKLKPRETVLADGDRVELYRPLTVDPKVARRARAEKKKAAPRT